MAFSVSCSSSVADFSVLWPHDDRLNTAADKMAGRIIPDSFIIGEFIDCIFIDNGGVAEMVLQRPRFMVGCN